MSVVGLFSLFAELRLRSLVSCCDFDPGAAATTMSRKLKLLSLAEVAGFVVAAVEAVVLVVGDVRRRPPPRRVRHCSCRRRRQRVLVLALRPLRPRRPSVVRAPLRGAFGTPGPVVAKSEVGGFKGFKGLKRAKEGVRHRLDSGL